MLGLLYTSFESTSMNMKIEKNTASVKVIAIRTSVTVVLLASSTFFVTASNALVEVAVPDVQVQIISTPVLTLGQGVSANKVEEKVDLRQRIIKQSHYQDSEIDVEIGLHQISLSLNNTRSNGIGRSLRLKDATLLASIIEKGIKADHQFSDVNAIHINYFKLGSGGAKIIQAFDFFQTSAGVFILNRS